jgi:hypothetical protein
LERSELLFVCTTAAGGCGEGRREVLAAAGCGTVAFKEEGTACTRREEGLALD